MHGKLRILLYEGDSVTHSTQNMAAPSREVIPMTTTDVVIGMTFSICWLCCVGQRGRSTCMYGCGHPWHTIMSQQFCGLTLEANSVQLVSTCTSINIVGNMQHTREFV